MTIQFIKDLLYSQHIKKLIPPIKGSFKSVYKDWKNVDDFFFFLKQLFIAVFAVLEVLLQSDFWNCLEKKSMSYFIIGREKERTFRLWPKIISEGKNERKERRWVFISSLIIESLQFDSASSSSSDKLSLLQLYHMTTYRMQQL